MDMEEWNLEEVGQPQEEPPKRRPPRRRRMDFAKGMVLGIAGTLVVAMTVALAARGFRLPGNQGSQAQGAAGAASGSEIKDALFQEDVKEKAGEIADLIDQYYYEGIDTDAMKEGVYAGMVNGLGDPYSSYFTAEEYASFNESTTGVYYGIGVVLQQNAETKAVMVLHVYPDTPAEEAGMKDGDMIVKIDDVEVKGQELTELVNLIKGQEGTKVCLQLARDGEKDYVEANVERRQIEVPTVQYQMLEGNVGFIQVTEFSDSTPEQFQDAIQELEGQGMGSMIVDLRDNPGGVLKAVCTMLDILLPKGLLVYTEDKYGNRSDYESDDACMDIPMAVLVNGNSASASEIFAGAVKDYGYGTLIGTKTFGKGIVQTIIPLSDGSAVKMTMAKYFTPKGNYIHGVGIEPDIELDYQYQGKDDKEYNPMHDNQVQKALEVLKEKAG
ncbi:MAG: S41 family peptidase [Lachnospiraceae bacterium]|jgi:carboxyl-terminal processing protease|nr:S41 family peptidase [Lachnospiraceae bacterium]